MKIAQCWDDGVVDDIRLIEILRKHGAKASFNLCYGSYGKQRRSSWKFQGTKDVWALSKQELTGVYEGFVVANHTISHPWLSKIPLNEAEHEIRGGKNALEQLFGYEVTGFAYPFGDHNPAVEEIVKATGHLYARTTGDEHLFPPANPMSFHPHCHFKDPQFWDIFERAKKADPVFYFWGHSYELVTEEDWRAFDANISRLSKDPDAEWVNLPDLFKEAAPSNPARLS